MCLIVDANAASLCLGQPGPVRNWLFGRKNRPRLVTGGRLREELAQVAEVRKALVELERAGRLRSAEAALLRKQEVRLRSERLCRSNDAHVLALALVTGARTLATFDEALSSDFRNRRIIDKPRGSVYRDPDRHGHLLRHTPRSCGVRAR